MQLETSDYGYVLTALSSLSTIALLQTQAHAQRIDLWSIRTHRKRLITCMHHSTTTGVDHKGTCNHGLTLGGL